MKKIIALLLAAFVGMLVLVVGGGTQANAHQDIAKVTQKQAIVQTVKAPTAAQLSTWHVPNITCETPTTCYVDYYGNGALEGYWMAKRWNGAAGWSVWVRLTRVNGADWNNDYVAPISCPQEDSCVQATYYDHANDICYLMARQSSGSTWVRESRVHDYGDF